MDNNEVSISVKNTISTVDKGYIILTTLKQGY